MVEGKREMKESYRMVYVTKREHEIAALIGHSTANGRHVFCPTQPVVDSARESSVEASKADDRSESKVQHHFFLSLII